MADANALVNQAIQAYKANDKAAAKDLLLKAVDLDERHEQAWMWMSAVVDSLEEQQICLENVIALNPNNEKAQKGLAIINQKLGKSSPPASSPPATEFDSNPFGSLDAPSQPPAPSNIPTSVDWGNPNTPAAYGSGKQVDVPSTDQYDDWINNLGIGTSGSAPAQTNPFTSLDWDGLNMSSSPAEPAAPASADPWSSADPWASIGSSSSPPPVEPAAPANTDPWGSVGTPSTGPLSGSSSANTDPWGSADPWGSVSSSPPPAAPAAPANTDPWGSVSRDSSPFEVSGASEPFQAESSWGSSTPQESAGTFGSSMDRETDPYESASTYESSSGGFEFDSDDETYEDETYTSFDFEETFDVTEDDFVFEDESTDFDFGIDDDDDFDPFSDNAFDFDNTTSPFATGGSAKSVSQYHKYIPQELRSSGGGSNRGMMVMVVLLLLLNAAAVVGLVLA